MSTVIDFAKAADQIVLTLKARSAGMTDLERIRFVYNEAIDDAANFAKNMARTNPQHAVAFRSLEAELRHWLTLR